MSASCGRSLQCRQPFEAKFLPVPPGSRLKSQDIPEPSSSETYTELQARSISHSPTSVSQTARHTPIPAITAIPSPLTPISDDQNNPRSLTGKIETISTTPPTLRIQPHHPTSSSQMLALFAQITPNFLQIFLLYCSYGSLTVIFRLDPTSIEPECPTVMDVRGTGKAWRDAILAGSGLDMEMYLRSRRVPRRKRKGLVGGAAGAVSGAFGEGLGFRRAVEAVRLGPNEEATEKISADEKSEKEVGNASLGAVEAGSDMAEQVATS